MRPKVEKVHKRIDKVLESIVNEHKATQKTDGKDRVNDLVAVLLNLQKNGGLEFPLTNNNIKAVILVSMLFSTEYQIFTT